MRSKVRCNGQVESVLESLIALRGRKAFKDFGGMEGPEKLSGVFLEESQEAKDLEVERDGEDIVDSLDELAIAARDHAQ
jgi:hypothetical protein